MANDPYDAALRHAACRGGPHGEAVIRALVDDGADINAQNKLGSTALMMAAHNGGEHAEAMMRVLLGAGAAVDAQAEDGSTALMMAAQCGGEHAEAMMRTILSAGADANKQNEHGATVLIFAAEHGGEHAEGMMRLLLGAGAAVDAQNKDGGTALMYAARYGGGHAAGMMRVMLSAGAAANKQNTFGWTALMFAIQWGGEHALQMMRALLSGDAAAANADMKNETRRNALWFAAQHPSTDHATEMVRLLVARGARARITGPVVNIPPAIGEYLDGALNWTPLHRAADARDFDMLLRLMRAREGLCDDEIVEADEMVESLHPEMTTVLGIAGSDEYPTARPVDGRCFRLVRCGAVWSEENHAIFPIEEERIAARSRALMMGVKRKDAQNALYNADIGPARGTDGEERRLPRDIWDMVFGFLVFAPPPAAAARATKRRRVDE